MDNKFDKLLDLFARGFIGIVMLMTGVLVLGFFAAVVIAGVHMASDMWTAGIPDWLRGR